MRDSKDYPGFSSYGFFGGWDGVGTHGDVDGRGGNVGEGLGFGGREGEFGGYWESVVLLDSFIMEYVDDCVNDVSAVSKMLQGLRSGPLEALGDK